MPLKISVPFTEWPRTLPAVFSTSGFTSEETGPPTAPAPACGRDVRVVFCAHSRELNRLPAVTTAAVLMTARRFNNRSDIDLFGYIFQSAENQALIPSKKELTRCQVLHSAARQK